MMVSLNRSSSGISPVVGMLLMVVVTVVIFVGASSVLFNFTDDVDEGTVKADVSMKVLENGVQARLESNGNADKIIFKPPEGSVAGEKELTSVGQAVVIEGGNGTYRVVGVNNGTEEVIESVDATIKGEKLVELIGSPVKNGTNGMDIYVVYRGPSTTFDEFQYIDYRSGDQIEYLNLSYSPGRTSGEVDIEGLQNATDGKIVTSKGGGTKSAVYKNVTSKFSYYTGKSVKPTATSGESRYRITINGTEDNLDSVQFDRNNPNFRINLRNSSTGAEISVPLRVKLADTR